METINMEQWVADVIQSPERIAIPVMTHPGIEMIGKQVVDACRSGQTHFDAIYELYKRYPAAATTAIMDLTVEAEAFGAEIVFPDNEVPSVIGRLVSSKADVEALQIPSIDTARVPEYLKANKLSAAAIQDKPVFSGCIGPFSLAGRLYDMTEIMMALYIEPDTIKLLLEKCATFITKYILALKACGTNGVILAEPAAGLLSPKDCQTFSSDFIRPIVEAVQDEHFAVVLHNCGNTGHCTASMVATGAMAYHFGNKIDILAALKDCPADTLVMGNIDPVSVMKQASADEVKKAVEELLNRTAEYPNYVLSTGCDVPPLTPEANIEAFYEALRKYNG